MEGNLQRLVLVITSVASKEVLERWAFDIEADGAVAAEGCRGRGMSETREGDHVRDSGEKSKFGIVGFSPVTALGRKHTYIRYHKITVFPPKLVNMPVTAMIRALHPRKLWSVCSTT
eukprot:9028090-Pyramimonas_sp.AAC.1